MAAYGSGYYGGGNYSYGVSLGAFAVEGASTVTAAGVRYALGAFAVSSASLMAADSVVVKLAAADMPSSSAISCWLRGSASPLGPQPYLLRLPYQRQACGMR
jgi:hypothetical protein